MARANLTGPEAVPPDLTRPSAAYRRLTWVVAAAIVGTVGFYVALLGLLVTNLGLTWTLRGTDDPRFALGVVSAVFGVPVVAMLVVSLFDRRKAASDPTELEISAADEPALHASIAEIADRVGAPRPRRVLLVPGVTAAVQYDTTLANLVRPLRKDLVIGLGLVEACTRDQLVAVLAHEFGHFSQSSLRLGVWVYVSTGIVERVSATGAGDRLLRGMAGIDGRLAILAALIQLVLNGVRAALGGLLWVVHLPARALSREQELHADKVAVSIAGSDALIEALARLAQADAAFDAALLRHQGQVGRGSYPADLYRAQSDALTRIEVTHPHLPRIARADPPDPHLRLFADEAPPPAMWATHPDGRTREDSAKAPYVAAPRDDRPAWSLFADPERLRRAMTERVNRTRFGMPADAAPRGADDAPDDAVEVLPAIHVHDYVTIGVADVEAWIAAGPTAAMTDDALVTALAARHGPETRALCTRRSRHVDELRSLLGLATGTRSFDGARFRGQDVYRGEVLGLAAQVRDEWAQDLVAIDDAHRDARRACRAAAERLGPAWVDQHRLALAWLWYAEQEDLWSQATRNQLVALLDRATSGTHTAAGIERMCERLGELHDEFQRTASRLGGMRAPGWPAGASIGEPPIAAPDLVEWNPRWVARFFDQDHRLVALLVELVRAATVHLLAVEAAIEAAWLSEVPREPPAFAYGIPTVNPAPLARSAPIEATRIPARVQRPVGGSPSLRIAAAAAVLVIPVGVFAVLSANVLVAYNGTGAPQTVAMGGWSVTLDPTEYAQTWSIAPWPRQVVTVGPDGAPLESARWARGDAVYNVGRRGVLMSGVAVYSEHGDVPSPDPVLVGNPLLAEVSVDHWFAEPPEQISRRTSRWSYVVDLVRTEPLPGLLGAPAVSETLARAILTWDPPSQPWVDAARALSAIDAEEALRVTAEARDRHGDALFAHLAFQAVRDDADLRAAYDARARELDTAEAWYLAGRVDDPPEARSAYRTALDRDPTFHRPWCGLAWLDAQASQWAEVGPELADCDVTTAAYQRLRLLAWRFDGAEGLPPGVDDPIVSAMVAAEVDPASTLRWTTQLPPSAQPMLFLAAGDLAHASSALAALDPDPAQALRIALSTGAAADAVPDAAALTGLVDAAIPTLADGPDADALIIAAAAAVTGRTEAVAVGESPYAALITSFLAADPRDLAALEQVAEALPPTSHGALYAAAVVRSRADPNPAVVDRARRLSIPGSVPKVW